MVMNAMVDIVHDVKDVIFYSTNKTFHLSPNKNTYFVAREKNIHHLFRIT